MSAYEVLQNPSYDPTRDLDAWPIDGSLQTIGFRLSDEINFDAPVRFHVDEPLSGLTDMPVTGRALPLLSRRMIRALTEVGGFRYAVYDALLVDRSNVALAQGAEDFALLHLLDPPLPVDLIDRDRAMYWTRDAAGELVQGGDGPISRVSMAALLESEQGLPTMFRVDAVRGAWPLFNGAARDALQGMLGFTLSEIPTRRRGPLVG